MFVRTPNPDKKLVTQVSNQDALDSDFPNF